jgi:hypothetical protein
VPSLDTRESNGGWATSKLKSKILLGQGAKGKGQRACEAKDGFVMDTGSKLTCHQGEDHPWSRPITWKMIARAWIPPFSSLYLILFFKFLLFYYSYVYTKLGSFLPPTFSSL